MSAGSSENRLSDPLGIDFASREPPKALSTIVRAERPLAELYTGRANEVVENLQIGSNMGLLLVPFRS